MKKLALMGWVVALAESALAWTPPASPDVDDILHQARADVQSRRLEDAAAKHRWYHDNVLRINPAHSGVRLSFALADWYALAEQYPPAMRDFIAARDRAALRARQKDGKARVAVLELVRLNERLRDWRHTAAAFEWLESNDPYLAKEVAMEVLPALVQCEAFELALRHLEVGVWQRRHAEMFTVIDTAPPGVDASMVRRSAERFMDHLSAPMVLVLVKAGRVGEAQSVLDGLKRIVGADTHTPLSEAALRGQMPPATLY